LNLTGKPVRVVEETIKEQVLAFLMNPDIAFALLVVGLFAIYAEFNHPGAVWPGTVGVVFILLAVFAMHLLPIRFAAVVLIFASFVLFALDAKFGTHGALAIGGIATLVIGALLLVDAPIPEMRVKLLTALAVSVPLGVITVFLMTIALRARANKVVTGAEGLIGEVGVAQTALAPAGKIFIHGEMWDAVASANVSVGEKVVVQKVNGLELKVDPTHDDAKVTVSS
jgi:membrane-bound serine protease (ClpP class)